MITAFLFILGAAMGSFANATVWRLRRKRNLVSERSECEHCRHELAAKDLIPIVSWLWLRGKCRYCRKSISVAHVVVEAATGLLFVAPYLWWPHGVHDAASITLLAFWLAYLVGIVMLFLYDLKWQLLPDKIVFTLIGLSVVGLLVGHVWLAGEGMHAVISAAIGVAVFAGFFALLFAVSGGKWIGLGDVKLAIFMGIVLGWPASLIALVGSYYVGAFIIVPLLLMGKVTPRSKVAFGPFLLISFYLSNFLSTHITYWFTMLW